MALNDDIAFLAKQPLLGLMDHDALRLVAFAAENRILRAGDVLFRRNDGSDGAYLVVSGAIALMSRDDGQPADEVVGPGGLIGELALFASIKRPVTAVAREPTQLMKLSRSVMRRVLGESPQSAQAIAAAIGERLQGFMSELSQVRDALIAIDRS
ncbi:cyclic nucleotide-binding domain-containing protein [Bosea sp. 2KB_26]|uniref:cyclic nucleotide-binding domain-containing protein n=1 Tax=unclassified Bosea (in: a-proteobacteria) TaxID=2653178 RepID=UPI000852C8A3|nr:cyclic nucleotide-binding domain-containing protein [Bosea sp. BIWAKO-01]GAU82213.1 cAMP-binding proteins - catabolite gene activator and regulatory subunit of cAMP-dependent protein kinases [Bosea sp. BIWAKO-01]